MNFLHRLWMKTRLWWNGPNDTLLDDYECLVRLARRCAYDFSHASDFIPTPSRPKIYWDPGIEWGARAQMWTGLFAKGNPGKDYRQRVVMDLEIAEKDRDDLIDFIKEKGLLDEIPGRILERYRNDIPF